MDIVVRYCSKTKFGNTRRIAEAIADEIGITVCEDYFYAHMLNIDGKLETAKEFGKRMIEQ